MGLLVDPPERSFACGCVIYLADSVDDAHRWAGEIARALGTATPMVLLEVDLAGVPSVLVEDTELGVPQRLVREDLVAARVRVVAEFDADPVPNPARNPGPSSNRHDGAYSGRQSAEDGDFECPVEACPNVYRSEAGLECHLEQDHGPGDLA